MSVSSDTLRQVGEALYGPRFASDLARDLRMSDRNMRRLLAGEHDVSPGIWRELLCVVDEHEHALGLARTAIAAAGRAAEG